MNSYYKGLLAEYLALFILLIKGYRILARRYKTKYGEVDIITKKGKSIIGIEIKFRQNKILTTEFVSKKQINRIKNSLNFFISKNKKYIDFNINIEIIIFANYFNCKHFKNLEV
jgi:putative endonuclease